MALLTEAPPTRPPSRAITAPTPVPAWWRGAVGVATRAGTVRNLV